MLSHFSRVRLFATQWTKPTKLLCSRDSPGKSGLPFPSPGYIYVYICIYIYIGTQST